MNSEFELQVPDKAVFLSVGVPDRYPELHAIVESLRPLVYRRFQLLTTGFEVPTSDLEYIGGFVRNDRMYHLFEELPPNSDNTRVIRCRPRPPRPLAAISFEPSFPAQLDPYLQCQ